MNLRFQLSPAIMDAGIASRGHRFTTLYALG